MTGLLLVVCSMTLASHCKCTITKVGLRTWNLEIAVCCWAESRVNSIWSAELTEIFWCSAMDSFEAQKTELVPDSLRHALPMKSIAQQTRYGCQPTRMADKCSERSVSGHHFHFRSSTPVTFGFCEVADGHFSCSLSLTVCRLAGCNHCSFTVSWQPARGLYRHQLLSLVVRQFILLTEYFF